MSTEDLSIGQIVLARNIDTEWAVDFFSRIQSSIYPYVCIGNREYEFCVPLTKETEHLVGTRDAIPVDESTRFKCGQWVEVEYNGGERATALYLRYETQDSGANHQVFIPSDKIGPNRWFTPHRIREISE